METQIPISQVDKILKRVFSDNKTSFTSNKYHKNIKESLLATYSYIHYSNETRVAVAQLIAHLDGIHGAGSA